MIIWVGRSESLREGAQSSSVYCGLRPTPLFRYNKPMIKQTGRIIIPANVNIWPHELCTAQALATVGYTVEFVPPANTEGNHTADVLLDGVPWEFKAPKSGQLDAIERNLKKGSKQSGRIVFDSRRMKRIPDKVIARELATRLKKQRTLAAIIFVNRHGTVIDIAPVSD
ncbi:MAG: hypothetical protein LBI64_00455 [Coriobacteriales bacterium]|jgi:hypothetical protein|nr:hypothetical protein [Coriobacteriales bacterium]